MNFCRGQMGGASQIIRPSPFLRPPLRGAAAAAAAAAFSLPHVSGGRGERPAWAGTRPAAIPRPNNVHTSRFPMPPPPSPAVHAGGWVGLNPHQRGATSQGQGGFNVQGAAFGGSGRMPPPPSPAISGDTILLNLLESDLYFTNSLFLSFCPRFQLLVC